MAYVNMSDESKPGSCKKIRLHVQKLGRYLPHLQAKRWANRSSIASNIETSQIMYWGRAQLRSFETEMTRLSWIGLGPFLKPRSGGHTHQPSGEHTISIIGTLQISLIDIYLVYIRAGHTMMEHHKWTGLDMCCFSMCGHMRKSCTSILKGVSHTPHV